MSNELTNSNFDFESKFKKFLNKRNTCIKCKNCKNKKDNTCDCNWSHGPALDDITVFIKSYFGLSSFIVKSQPLRFDNIFKKTDYQDGSKLDSLNFSWSKNDIHIIFPFYNIKIICDNFLVNNIPYFKNIINGIWSEKPINFKYYNYQLSSWMDGPTFIIVNENTTLDMICFYDRPYETLELDGSTVQIGKKWYKNTFSEEVFDVFNNA